MAALVTGFSALSSLRSGLVAIHAAMKNPAANTEFRMASNRQSAGEASAADTPLHPHDVGSGGGTKTNAAA